MSLFYKDTALLERIQKLELRMEYLETKEEGEWLAYQVARLKFGLDSDMAEKRGRYVGATNLDGTGKTGCWVMIMDDNDCYKWKGTIQEAKALVNELEAKQHRKCLDLSEKEEKLILDRRSKDWDSHWVQVKPRKKKGK